MKLTKTHNRILGGLLFTLAIIIAFLYEGLWVNFSAGLLAGSGIVLLIKGRLRPEKN